MNTVDAVLSRISAKLLHINEPEFRSGTLGNGFFVQLIFKDASGTEQRCRKWYVSKWATESEIAQTCLTAMISAMEHEVREAFFYNGQPVFGPHFSVNELAERIPTLDVR